MIVLWWNRGPCDTYIGYQSRGFVSMLYPIKQDLWPADLLSQDLHIWRSLTMGPKKKGPSLGKLNISDTPP